MNSPSLTNHNNISSLLEGEERAESKNTLVTSKNYLIIKATYGSITKECLFLSHGLRCVCSSTMNSWVHRLGFQYKTIKKTPRRKSLEGNNNILPVEIFK